MTSQSLDISDSQETQDMNKLDLPIEIWSKIFGFLDFKTQNRATLVHKSWLAMIRNDFKLSGELALNSIDKMEATEINSLISKWKKLMVLRALNTWHPQPHTTTTYGFHFPTVDLKILEIQFSLCPTLEKVVVPVVTNTTIKALGLTYYFDEQAVYDLSKTLPSWARVSKIWFDPQMKELQKLGLENISELCLEFDEKTELVESFRTSGTGGAPPIFERTSRSFNFLLQRPSAFVCAPNFSDFPPALSLETIGASMVNLDSLCIWITYPEDDIDYCLPLLKNLPNNLHLKIIVEDDPIESDYFCSFIKQFALKVSSLNVDMRYIYKRLCHV